MRTAARRPLATIGFRLSKRATVRLRFAERHRSGGMSTIKPALRVKGRAGRNGIRFAGRLSRRVALKPGKYRLTAIATDAAGVRSAPVRTRFHRGQAARLTLRNTQASMQPCGRRHSAALA